jgi:DNA-binding GntR family transcriptional regulator
MVLARDLSDSTPLPTEPNLMELFGVSRGTLRRAIEELVRDGLLSAEQGRGTFVVQEERVRRVVSSRFAF